MRHGIRTRRNGLSIGNQQVHAAISMTTQKTKTLHLNPRDNVASALDVLTAGERVAVYADTGAEPLTIALKDDIPLGHKFALQDISQGGEIIKFGMVIGKATTAIAIGSHVSEHNLE